MTGPPLAVFALKRKPVSPVAGNSGSIWFSGVFSVV